MGGQLVGRIRGRIRGSLIPWDVARDLEALTGDFTPRFGETEGGYL